MKHGRAKVAIAIVGFTALLIVAFVIFRRMTVFSHPMPSDLPFLVESLNSDDWLTRCRAADAIGKLGPMARDAVPALVEAFFHDNCFPSNQDWLGRTSAGEAIVRISPGVALETFLDGTTHANSELRRASCHLMSMYRFPPEVVGPAILNLVNDEEWLVRRYAVSALGDVRAFPEDDVPALMERVSEDEHPQVREWAASSLAEYGRGAAAAIPTLLAALDDEEHVRAACIRAIANIDRSRLLELANHPNEQVREMVKEYGIE